jgi:cytochrome c oxidase subunit I+III
VWAMLVTSFCIIFAMPSIVVCSSMLISDRLVGTHFFNPAEGGDALLWQHLFWFFGHPEVYIIFLPAVGMAGTIIETGARRPMVGYPLVVVSTISIGFLSFGLWVHHMFATGLPRIGNSLFTASSMAIAIPTGATLFCWIATCWGRRIRLTTPVLFIAAFFLTFLSGGLTGVMLASVPFDQQATDSYFVVGHLHYVLLGGAVAPLMGAFYYWFPKFSGRTLSERIGRWHAILFILGVNLTFAPMLALGVRGMTRRVYTYPAHAQWGALNFAATVGAVILAVSFLVFLVNILRTLRGPANAPDNPWDAGTLEWGCSSPPPPYNFTHVPLVESRAPLWDDPERLGGVTGLQVASKEVVVTRGMEAVPDLREPVPPPTLWPLIAAAATTAMLVGSIFKPSALAWGSIPVAIGMVGWLYPRSRKSP